MEGFMLLPPERGSIIGRQLWKPRYIVLGSAALKETPPENILQRSHPSGRVANARKGLKASTSKTALGDGSDANNKPAPPGVYLSIYKAKGDWEFISQHPVSSFETCDIQAVEHRKQAPSLPTLVINLRPDEEMEKARKRRSSRTGGLTSSKDPWANTLLFRTVPEERYNIYDWQVTIKPLVKPSTPPEVLSPISPAFSSFSNPFATRVGETASRERERPGTSSSQGADYLLRGVSIQTTTTTTYSPRSDTRPSAMISPSPSLRSRRSDLSSQASSQPMGFTSTHAQHYTTALPSDLPSPASTSGYETQLIEGWTSAQGRSSALSSHTRGSNSISIASAVAPLPIGAISSSPPGPRETILDRAFKNRVIPGSDRVQDSEDDKISSIARFEALMREVDEKKEQKIASSRLDNSRNIQGWELDEESEDSDYEEFAGEEEDEAEGIEMEEDISIPTPAQRALDYISGRRTPHPPASSHGRPMSPTSPPIPFLNQQAMSAFHGHADSAGGLRPRTGTSSRPTSLAFPTRASSSAAVSTSRDANIPTGEELEQRRFSTGQKRLSFQEFTRRLSSTSSLLLVQTNASSASGSQQSKRGSSDVSVADEELANKGGLRNSVVLRGGAGTTSASTKEERDKRCGWRGSVGVFGNEGGFL